MAQAAMALVPFRCVLAAQEVEQQPDHRVGLLLLHPMSGAIDQMAADHSRAGGGLHGFEHARPLIFGRP